MCSNASITEILGINDKNLVILGNEKDISNIDSLYQKELNLINGWLNND